MALTDWIFGRGRAPVVEERAVIDRTPIGQPPGGAQAYISTYADTGRTITPENARESPTVYACTRLISQSIARMEWRVMRREDGIAVPAREHPLYRLLNVEPTGYMGAMVWRESMLLDCLLYGNAYAVIERDPSGRPIGLHKLRADSVEVTRGEDGAPIYSYHSAIGGGYTRSSQVWQGYDIFHLRAPSLDGLLGETPIYLVRNIIGVELEAEKYVASFFRNGARPAGLIKVTGTLTDEALKRLRQSWQAVTGGAENAGRVAILESGYDWESVSVNPEEAKLVELRSYCRSQIASAFNVPVHMVGDASKTSYASAEQGNSEFVQHCLSNWASRFEEECARKLIRDNEEIDTQISFDAMLRGDLSSRFSAYSVALNNGFLTINEVREREQYAPIDGGDVARAPVNLAIVDPNVGKPGDQSQIGQPPAAPGMVAGPGSIAKIGPEEPAEPVADPVAGGEPVANTALNGAQVSSLVALASKVKTGEIPKGTAIAIAKAAFPAIDAALIDAMFAPITEGTSSNQEQTNPAIPTRSVRNCGTGSGGFQPGNDCSGEGGGDGSEEDSSESDSTPKSEVPLESDRETVKSTIKTEDGEEIEVLEVMKGQDRYLTDLHDDGEERGLATSFDSAKEMQTEDAEPDEMLVEAYAGSGYPALTGQRGQLDSSVLDHIDSYGSEYGTISSDMASEIQEERYRDYKRSIEDDSSWFDGGREKWEALTEDEQFEAKEEHLDQKYTEIGEEVEREREDARNSAIREMRSELESKTALSRLDCCIQLFRGIDVRGDALDAILRDGVIRHSAVNSWTTNTLTARTFSKGQVVLVARSPKVGWVNKDDQRREEEVIRPPSSMRIAKVVRSRDGTTFLFVDEDPDYID